MYHEDSFLVGWFDEVPGSFQHRPRGAEKPGLVLVVLLLHTANLCLSAEVEAKIAGRKRSTVKKSRLFSAAWPMLKAECAAGRTGGSTLACFITQLSPGISLSPPGQYHLMKSSKGRPVPGPRPCSTRPREEPAWALSA